MRWFEKLVLRFRSLFRRERVEQDLDDELLFHLERQIEANLATGMTPKDARNAALRTLGGLEQIKEECRDMRGVNWIENFVKDVRYALRTMRRSPAFTAVAVLSLAIGIGANAAIFSFANAILLKKLPVLDPQRLVIVRQSVSYPFFNQLAQRNQALAGLSGRFSIELNVTAGDSTERMIGELVSGSYFRVLGVSAVLGRVIAEEDDGAEGAHPVCVINYDLWQDKFGGDPQVLNRAILLNARPFQIIGVAQRGFHGSALQGRTDVFVSTSMTALFAGEKRDSTGWSWLQMIGRLRPGVTREQAEANINVVGHQIDPELGRKRKTSYQLLRGDQGFDTHRSQFEKPIVVLVVLVGSVLLIACVNIANLLLARGMERTREIAIRLALGATRARLIGQLLTESLMLSSVGGAAGFLLSFWMMQAFVRFLRDGRSFIEAQPDLLVLMFTLGLSVVTGLIFGLLPAWQTSRPAVAPALKEEAAAGWRSRTTVRRILVVTQIAFSLVLVFAAGMFARTLGNLRMVDLGFQPEQIVLMSLNPSRSGQKESETALLYEQLLDNVRRLPDVKAASLTNVPVLSGNMFAANVRVPGYQPKENEPNNYIHVVSPDYFRTLATPILMGRDFDNRDRKGSQGVAVINQRFASYYWPGQSPIGKHFRWGGGREVEVVGLAKNTKYQTIREEAQLIFYLPVSQLRFEELTLLVRTGNRASEIVARIRDVVRRLDPKLPVYDVKTLETQIDTRLSQERILASLSMFFSVSATLLAAFGLYGVVAYSVKRRFREIGIRVALGARPAEVVLLFLRESLVMVVAGIGIGITFALAVARYSASLLYGLNQNDAVTLVTASLLLLLVALIAAFVPALRATRVDPMAALRCE